MQQFGGKDSKRHFTVVMGGKEHGLYVSSTPSSAAKKAVTKLCSANKSKKVEFHIREITQGSKKKTYGSYIGYIEKLKEPIELKGRVIRYKPVAKLSRKLSAKKGGGSSLKLDDFKLSSSGDKFKYDKPFFGSHKLFFGIPINNQYFSIALSSDGSLDVLDKNLKILHYDFIEIALPHVITFVLNNLFSEDSDKFNPKIKELLNKLRTMKAQIIQQQQLKQQQINPDKNKILIVSIDPSNLSAFTIKYNEKSALLMVNEINNKSSYLLFDETRNIPLGTFEYYLSNDYTRDRVINLLNQLNPIVIKINQQGSLKELFGALVSNSNVINNKSKLSNTNFNRNMQVVDNYLERKLDEQQEE
jgi:hypothetical protein